MKRVSDFFLFSSIYIAVCATVMAYSTYLLFNYTVNYYLLAFIFTGTICSYNFHWLLTPAAYGGSEKTRWSYSNRSFHIVLLVIGAIGAGISAIKLLHHWEWLIATAFITFLYSAPKVPLRVFQHLRQVAYGKTVFLAFAWTHIPFILPLIYSDTAWHLSEMSFIWNRFFLIYPICILFDYRDRQTDIKEGIRSIVTDLPERSINVFYYGSLVVFFITGYLLLQRFNMVTISMLAIPGIILLLTYEYSKKNRSDYYYYFFLDGLMMLSSLLLLLLFIIHL